MFLGRLCWKVQFLFDRHRHRCNTVPGFHSGRFDLIQRQQEGIRAEVSQFQHEGIDDSQVFIQVIHRRTKGRVCKRTRAIRNCTLYTCLTVSQTKHKSYTELLLRCHIYISCRTWISSLRHLLSSLFPVRAQTSENVISEIVH